MEEEKKTEPILPETESANYKKNKTSYFILFFLLGLINNLGSLVILCGSNVLAAKFDLRDYMAFYPMSVNLI